MARPVIRQTRGPGAEAVQRCPLVPEDERDGFLRDCGISKGMIRFLESDLPQRFIWPTASGAYRLTDYWSQYPKLQRDRWAPVKFDGGIGWFVKAGPVFGAFDMESGIYESCSEEEFFRRQVVENDLGGLDEVEFEVVVAQLRTLDLQYLERAL